MKFFEFRKLCLRSKTISGEKIMRKPKILGTSFLMNLDLDSLPSNSQAEKKPIGKNSRNPRWCSWIENDKNVPNNTEYNIFLDSINLKKKYKVKKAKSGRRFGFQEKREDSIFTKEKAKRIIKYKAVFLSKIDLTTM